MIEKGKVGAIKSKKSSYIPKEELELKEEQNDDLPESSDNSLSDEEDYDEMRPRKEKVNKKNIGSIVSTLLANKKKSLPNKNDKAIKKEEKARMELLKKKRDKRKQRKFGYCSDLKKWVADEKAKVKVATKGVVKLFNSIYEIKRKVVEEQQQDSVVKEKKSKNFLMMHDLAPPKVGKSFKEDN